MIKRNLFILVLVLYSVLSYSQKKTALVLSGGGSRAVAHIGAIRALEEQQVKIDYIVGVSMGAFVGAMYASGMTPDEMEAFFLNNDVEAWVNENKDSMQQNLFMQDDEDASLVSIDFDINKKGVKYSVPTHFISANRLNFELMKMLSPSCVAAHNDFDRLMIPFRCVATNIDKNKLVVLKEGSLCRSVRASMTFPFLLDPIRIDSALLFDGGMMDNLPVTTAIEEFKPDIIIGSKAAGNYDPPSEDDLLSIIQNMLTKDTDFTTQGKEGFVLEMDLPSLDIVDFSQSRIIIDSAYIQMKRQLKAHQNVSYLMIEPYDLASKRVSFDDKKPILIVDTVTAVLAKQGNNEYVNSNLKRRKPITSYQDIEEDFFRKTANPSYKRVLASMPYNYKLGSYKLVYHLQESNPYSVDFGGNISSSNLTQAYLKLAYQNVGKNRFSSYLNGYFGQFYRSVKGNVRIDIPGKYPIAFQASGTFNQKNYFRGQTYFFEEEEPSYLKVDERFFEMCFSTPLSPVGKLFASLSLGTDAYRYYQNNNFTEIDTSDKTNIEYVSPSVGIAINSLNKKQFANRGLSLSVSLRYVSGLEKYYPGSTSSKNTTLQLSSSNYNYLKLSIDYVNYFLHHNKIHFGGALKASFSNQPFLNNYTSSILSAEQYSPTTESKALFMPNYRAYNSAALGLILSFDILNRLDWRTEAHYYQPYQRILSNEKQEAYFETKLSSKYVVLSTAFIYDTRIGPLSLHLNYYEDSSDPWNLMFTFGYVIFNRMSLE
ncbi:patatin-like phospholipase family protein [Lentimicrobium sp. S6]|uniref:patatin-like phospholipase family protein n=1 Tax=Lentimicrobium sp. S6 TaxID=2735872 RepID=UPI0015550A57|nr:patatin-like phospholipase family protein [Lentimicrobium sp. S6]NPD45211.1 patatin-like phospholipase family protein [Lentimicrobium sp. S6]